MAARKTVIRSLTERLFCFECDEETIHKIIKTEGGHDQKEQCVRCSRKKK